MHLSLFFFFKQKTAYELLISDWISDVCSSDLDDPAEGAVGARIDDDVQIALSLLMIDADFRFLDLAEGKSVFEQRDGQGLLPGQDGVGVDRIAWPGRKGGAQLRLALAGAFQDLPFDGRQQKSGRGSCRGRVCQYV